MFLRKKITYTTGGILLGLIAVIYLAATGVILWVSSGIEEQIVSDILKHAVGEIEARAERLQEKNSDWACWNDTYIFVQDLNQEYIELNLNKESLQILKVDVMLFFNQADQLVYSKGYDWKKEQEVPVADPIKEYFIRHPYFSDTPDITAKSGIISAGEYPVIISYHKITDSVLKAPYKGTLVFGRILTPKEIKKIAQDHAYPEIEMVVERLDNIKFSPDFQTALNHIEEGETPCIHIVKEDLIAGYTLLNDISGSPAFLLRITKPRHIYQLVKTGLLYFLISLIMVVVTFHFIHLRLLDKVIVSRIEKLNNEVGEIGKTGIIEKTVEKEGNDEISSLADEINLMLGRLRNYQNKLQESEEKFRSLVENLDVGVFRLVTSSGGSFLQINPAFCEMLGYSSTEEFCSNNFVCHFVDPSQGEHLISLVEVSGVVRQEILLRKKNGTLLIGWCIARTKYDEEGNMEWIDGVVEDITQKKKMEKIMVNKNRELNDFAYKVSHDIKSPLNVMKGYLDIIKKDPSLMDRYYDRVISQAEQTILFVDNLLRLSRAGRVIGDKKEINMEQLVRQIFITLKPQDHPIRLRLNSSNSLYYGDKAGMTQVFTNLIQNSIKFARAENPLIEMECAIRGNNMEILFSDNGRGIKKQVMAKIFLPGFTTDRKTGSGFGLAIVKKIIEAHRGDIQIQSQGENKGVRFIITLPIEELPSRPTNSLED